MSKFNTPSSYRPCQSDSQVPIMFQDEGVDLGYDGTVRVINFVGANVEAVRAGSVLTITITGGSGTSFEIPQYTDFESDGLPTGIAANYIARIVTVDPDYTDTIGGVQYYNNKIIYFDGANWISWSADYGTP